RYDVGVEAEPVTERFEQVQLIDSHGLREPCGRCELREAATIAGKHRWTRIAAHREPQQQLVRIIAREQALLTQGVPRAGRLDVREPAELAAAQPRQPQRHERLQPSALPAAGTARAARDDADAAMLGRDAFEQLARVAIWTLVQHEAVLEHYLLA